LHETVVFHEKSIKLPRRISQFITEKFEFDENALSKLLFDIQNTQRTKKFYVLAIIGIQGSGKSTLLNRLFGTQFDVKETGDDATQTTRGVWAAWIPEKNFLVCDIEGADSDIRDSRSRAISETSHLAFSLHFADALIINMVSSQIGQADASKADMFKTAFCHMLSEKSYGKGRQAKIPLIFAIRLIDKVEKVNWNKLKEKTASKFRTFYNEAAKNLSIVNLKYEDCFDEKFIMLPNFNYGTHDEWEYLIEMGKLNSILDFRAPNSVFTQEPQERSIFLIKSLWSATASVMYSVFFLIQNTFKEICRITES